MQEESNARELLDWFIPRNDLSRPDFEIFYCKTLRVREIITPCREKDEETYRGKILPPYKLFISSDYIKLLKRHYVSVIINDYMNVVKESNIFILSKKNVSTTIWWYRCNFILDYCSNVSIMFVYVRIIFIYSLFFWFSIQQDYYTNIYNI